MKWYHLVFVGAVSFLCFLESGMVHGRESSIPVTAKGPWGELTYSELIIEPPESLLLPQSAMRAHLEQIVWRFPGMSKQAVGRALRESGLGESDIFLLLRDSYSRVTDSGTEILPPDNFVMNMTAAQRVKLYPQVGGGIPNNPYDKPFFFDYRGFPSLAMNSGMSQDMVNIISSLSYKRYGPYHFSDISLVMRKARDEKERLKIYKTIKRQRSLSMQLTISNQDDFNNLADYWGGDGRNQAVLPMLKSVTSQMAAEKIDIVHLLPSTPRKLVNSYPNILMSVGISFPNCYWTAFNFFSDEPSDRFMNDVACRHVLESRYERAVKPWRLGDLVIISDDKGNWRHACNYVAGNIVFTKNGKDILRPWILEDIDSVLRNYLYSEQASAVFYRLKPGYSGRSLN